MSLTLRLTRVSPTHHAFAYIRADGSGETVSLETRTLLLHDLLHFAVESEAALRQSFYGKLAAGRTLAELAADAAEMQTGEAATTERAVGAMTGALKSEASAEQVVVAFKALREAMGEPAPAWFDPGFVERVRERMRRLNGAWKATPFGETLTLTFET